MKNGPSAARTSGLRQSLKALPLVFACVWLVAFLVFTAMDLRQWPRQAATLIALALSPAEAPAEIEGVSVNRIRGKMTSYDVTYAFRTPDGGRHSHTQRVHALAVPVEPWPRMVRYASWSPGLSALVHDRLGEYVWKGLAAPAIFAGVITFFGLVAAVLGLTGRRPA